MTKKINTERNTTVKRKILVTILSASLLSMSLTGCGGKAQKQSGDEPVAQETDENGAKEDADAYTLESGNVELTIWAEEAK